MDTNSVIEGIKNLIPGLLNNTKSTAFNLGKMISPDNPNLGVIVILIILALLLRDKIRGWMWIVLFIGMGYLFITGGI